MYKTICIPIICLLSCLNVSGFAKADTARVGIAVEQLKTWQQRQQRNPMQPIIKIRIIEDARADIVDLVLESVLISNTRRVAFINGIAYKTGEEKHGLRVVTISENSVVIEHDREQKHLQIIKPTVTR